jgi:hypothetical protein
MTIRLLRIPGLAKSVRVFGRQSLRHLMVGQLYAGGADETLRLNGGIVFPLIEPPQFSRRGRVANHFFGFMRELAHNLKQFKVTADRSIQFDSGEQQGKALVPSFAYLRPEAS